MSLNHALVRHGARSAANTPAPSTQVHAQIDAKVDAQVDVFDGFDMGGRRRLCSNMISLAIRDIQRGQADAPRIVQRHAERARDWVLGTQPGTLTFLRCVEELNMEDWCDRLRAEILARPGEMGEIFRDYERGYANDIALEPLDVSDEAMHRADDLEANGDGDEAGESTADQGEAWAGMTPGA
ncbi:MULTISPECIES: hypothetical protein [unclassified Burkholderia]|uniref:hypothetical protein n=1 Tax=unclassified Burkholderia TaxID=2613784 RepID=UPI002AB11C87|nr:MULTISPECIES: hypothetical protein [unclassified Burkholderia]